MLLSLATLKQKPAEQLWVVSAEWPEIGGEEIAKSSRL